MNYKDIQDRDGIQFGKIIRLDIKDPTQSLVGSSVTYPKEVQGKLKELGAVYMSRLILEPGRDVCERNLADGRTFWDREGIEVAHMTPGVGISFISRLWDEAYLKNQYFTDWL
jgi:hypothetical protein